VQASPRHRLVALLLLSVFTHVARHMSLPLCALRLLAGCPRLSLAGQQQPLWVALAAGPVKD
jgi:hypothetical protein